jgi:tetratricopeptide (TPR) repeat protein
MASASLLFYCDMKQTANLWVRATAILSFLLVCSVASAGETFRPARDAFEQANFAEVISLLEGPQEASPEALRLLGISQFQIGEFKAARETFRLATERQPGDADFHLWHGRSIGRLAEKASIFSAPGLAKKARDEFKAAVALDPDNLDAVGDLFEYYMSAPGFLGGGKDKAESLAETIQENQGAEYAYFQARLAERDDNYALAEEWLRKAIQLEPDRVSRHLSLASFFARRENFDSSEKALRAASEVDPADPEILYARAEILIRTKRNLTDARRLLEQYLKTERGPADPGPYEVSELRKKLEKASR